MVHVADLAADIEALSFRSARKQTASQAIEVRWALLLVRTSYISIEGGGQIDRLRPTDNAHRAAAWFEQLLKEERHELGESQES